MSLDAKILGLDQKVDFNDGSVSNVVRIELPNGSIVVALVTDEGAQLVFAAVQATKNVFKGRPETPPPAKVSFAPRPAAARESFEFGGDGFVGEPPEEDEPVVGPRLGPQLKRMPSPGADDAGNPVDASGTPLYERAPAPEEATTDEDGVRGL